MIAQASHASVTHGSATHGSMQLEFVTFRLAEQWLGIPVLIVQEVLMAQRIARVPLAPTEVSGFLNLRGQIVTAVNLRTRLALEPRAPDAEVMNVVICHDGELFSFLVDEVGDVLSVAADSLEAPPSTLDPCWRLACSGIIRRDRGLLVVVDASELLRLAGAAV